MIRFSRFALIATTSILATSTMAEEYRPTSTAEDRVWSGGAEVNANITTGNTDIQTIGGSLNVDYKPKPWTLGAKASFLRNTTDNVERAHAITGLVRAGANITNNVDFFAIGTALHNRYQGIELQWMAMPGVGIYAVNTDFISIRVEGGIGYMNENYTIGRVDDNFTVGGAGMGLKFKISGTTDFTTDAMWIVPLSESDDWRVTNVAAITTRMTEILSLKLAHNLQYRDLPVGGLFSRRPTRS